MRMSLILVGAVAITAGGFTACEPTASLACGSVLVRDTELTADISGCAGDGLIIGADDITVDLAGHEVSSAGGAGMVLADHDRVTIEGGTVTGISAGLSLTDAEHLTVRHISASGSDVGMHLVRVDDSAIQRVVGDGSDSFRLDASHRNRIRHVTSQADADDNSGITLVASHGNRIADSTLGGGTDGIVLVDSDANVVADNDASNSNGYGIWLQRSDGNVLRRNDTASEVAAIVVESSTDNLLVDNQLGRDNPGTGITIRQSDRTKLLRNLVEVIEIGASSGVVLTGNIVASSADGGQPDGIIISADSAEARLIENQAEGFSDDGIQVDASGTSLRDNVANGNGDLGIEAVAGVIDLGGNVASGNGNPVQCTNVPCAASGR